MSDLEPTNISTPTSGNDGDRLSALERQVSTVLLGLVILSCVFTTVMWRQSRIIGAELETANKIIEATKSEQQAMTQFLGKLAEYGKSHPDFKPIMDKYGLGQSPAPAPVTTPAPKK